MNKTIKTIQVVFILITFCLLNGCMFPLVGRHEQSIQERAIDEIYHISNADQRHYLENLNTADEVTEYLDNFWKQHDPTTETPENEFMQIYYSRLQYATDHFDEVLQPGSKTDRGRIYILYGPPDEINEESMFMDYMPANTYDDELFSTQVKSIIVWEYFSPADKAFTEEFTGRTYSSMYFVFADMEGYGTYSLIRTSVDEEAIDLRAWQ